MTASPPRPRVVLVCEATGGGVGKHVLDVAERLPRQGFDVLLAHADGRAEDDFLARVSRSAEHGYQVARVNVDRAPGPRDALGAWQLHRAVRAFGGADVLHGHSAKGGALARLARWGCARRVFYTPHAFYAQAPSLSPASRRFYAIAEYGLSLATDRVIATSNEEAKLAHSLGIPERKVTVVENGIDVRSDRELAQARARMRGTLGVSDDDVLVGFVGRLVPKKSPELAIDVFRRVADRYPQARFVLAGDGPDAPAVARVLDAAGDSSRVRWLRRASGRDLMPAMDVLLVTSHYEGFPYVMLEALDAGCAIVTTAVGGATDCVLDGRNGAIVARREAPVLADAVSLFVDHPDRRAEARALSRAHARRFDIARMLDRLVSLYRSDARDAA
jgi:glycosyltransferase involved in cell wall biosynthesis